MEPLEYFQWYGIELPALELNRNKYNSNFHWSPINNEWWKIQFEFSLWFTIEFPLIRNASRYLLNFPFAPHRLPLVCIYYHSTFNGKLARGSRVFEVADYEAEVRNSKFKIVDKLTNFVFLFFCSVFRSDYLI